MCLMLPKKERSSTRAGSMVWAEFDDYSLFVSSEMMLKMMLKIDKKALWPLI